MTTNEGWTERCIGLVVKGLPDGTRRVTNESDRTRPIVIDGQRYEVPAGETLSIQPQPEAPKQP